MLTDRELTLQMRLMDRIRFFNRRYFNPFSLSFAGRPYSFWSVVLHVGRKTGKSYVTPIVAVHKDSSILIPLPYGRQVDWFKNVMGAGSCGLIYQGKVYRASKLEMISLDEGAGAFAGWVQSRLRRANTGYLLRLNQLDPAENGEALYQSFTRTYPLARGLWVITAVGLVILGIARMISRRK